MSKRISFGYDVEIEFEPPHVYFSTDCAATRAQSLDDPMSATSVAVEAPLDFPPLSNAIVDGDQVVIAVGQGVPEVDAVVLGIVSSLQAVGRSDTRTTILCADAATAERLRAAVQAVPSLVHDPQDVEHLAYLAATKAGDPIYLNRLLTDADFLIPVGCLRPRGSFGHTGSVGDVLAAFTDSRTLAANRRIYLDANTSQLGRVESDTRNLAWSLGSRFAVQVLAGRAGTVLNVLAGEVDRVSRDGQTLADRAWGRPLPQRADLVVAAINGPASQQTWSSVAQALTSAHRIAQPDGSVLICSQVQEPSATFWGRLDAYRAGRQCETETTLETDQDWSAARLALAQGDLQVFLYNKGHPAPTDSESVVLIESDDEVRRLISRHASCAVLGNAQYILPIVTEQEAASL